MVSSPATVQLQGQSHIIQVYFYCGSTPHLGTSFVTVNLDLLWCGNNQPPSVSGSQQEKFISHLHHTSFYRWATVQYHVILILGSRMKKSWSGNFQAQGRGKRERKLPDYLLVLKASIYISAYITWAKPSHVDKPIVNGASLLYSSPIVRDPVGKTAYICNNNIIYQKCQSSSLSTPLYTLRCSILYTVTSHTSWARIKSWLKVDIS